VRKPKKITPHDLAALDLVSANGFVGLDARGSPFLESERQITRLRFRRLIAFGLLVSNEDALPGQLAEPQSYRPVAPHA